MKRQEKNCVHGSMRAATQAIGLSLLWWKRARTLFSACFCLVGIELSCDRAREREQLAGIKHHRRELQSMVEFTYIMISLEVLVASSASCRQGRSEDLALT